MVTYMAVVTSAADCFLCNVNTCYGACFRALLSISSSSVSLTHPLLAIVCVNTLGNVVSGFSVKFFQGFQ